MRLKKSALTWLSALALAIAGTMAAAVPASANLGVTVIAASTSANVSWVNPVVTFTGINVDYRLHAATAWTPAVSNVVTTSTVVQGLQPSTAYDFRITAFNGATELENYITTQTTTFAPACAPGTYSTTGYTDATCFPAQAGYFVPVSASTSQTACPPGRYSNQANATACTPARIGYYVPSLGLITDTICPAGTTTTVTGASACVSLSHPVPSVTKLAFGTFKPDTAASGSIIGENLSQASSVTVGTATATLGKIADESLAVTLPALKPGAYDLVIKFAGSGSYTIQSGIVIPQPEAPVVPAEVKVPAKPVTVTIGGFRTTATSLSTPQIAALSAGIAQAPAGCIVSATVVAYSAGGRAASAAAAARADQLNQILHAKFPGAQVSVSVVSSKALADARNVSVTFSPAN